MKHNIIDSNTIVNAYIKGYFPMSDGGNDNQSIYWVRPEIRTIIPLTNYHISKSLKKKIKHFPFILKINSNFLINIQMCTNTSLKKREDTWINQTIINSYYELHKNGIAHSIEAYNNKTKLLVGGLYGVAINGAFFGESMFSKQSDASKISLIYLITLLKMNNFKLLDCQFNNQHLKQFNSIEITNQEYLNNYLKKALNSYPKQNSFNINLNSKDFKLELIKTLNSST